MPREAEYCLLIHNTTSPPKVLWVCMPVFSSKTIDLGLLALQTVSPRIQHS